MKSTARRAIYGAVFTLKGVVSLEKWPLGAPGRPLAAPWPPLGRPGLYFGRPMGRPNSYFGRPNSYFGRPLGAQKKPNKETTPLANAKKTTQQEIVNTEHVYKVFPAIRVKTPDFVT